VGVTSYNNINNTGFSKLLSISKFTLIVLIHTKQIRSLSIWFYNGILKYQLWIISNWISNIKFFTPYNYLTCTFITKLLTSYVKWVSIFFTLLIQIDKIFNITFPHSLCKKLIFFKSLYLKEFALIIICNLLSCQIYLLWFSRSQRLFEQTGKQTGMNRYTLWGRKRLLLLVAYFWKNSIQISPVWVTSKITWS